MATVSSSFMMLQVEPAAVGLKEKVPLLTHTLALFVFCEKLVTAPKLSHQPPSTSLSMLEVILGLVLNIWARAHQSFSFHFLCGTHARQLLGTLSLLRVRTALLKHTPLNTSPPMRAQRSRLEEPPRGPSGPLGPSRPVLPRVPGGPCGPIAPVAPRAPRAPVEPIGPGGPSCPLGPTIPFFPGSPLMPSRPSYPAGPLGPCGPTDASFSFILASMVASSSLTASFILKSSVPRSSLSFFILSTLTSSCSAFFSTIFSSVVMRFWLSLTRLRWSSAASLSSTGHIGHPAWDTPTSPKRMMVGGGGEGGGIARTFTLPRASPSGDVIGNSPIGSVLM
mmetsp:Transcript_10902/g.26155  ORF Transcript_10902/g.26155 Transcript_10902/m.26155 type:complete len:336 (-) Transcript_10902:243-1250(-)